MATTTNYSWSTPDDTALVKDGAAAIRSLGTAIDTTVFTNAGAAINKTIIDAAGDLIYGTAADTAARLAIGTANQQLRVNSGATAPEWFTPAGSGGMTLISTTTLTGATVSLTSIPQTYKDLRLLIRNYKPASDTGMRLRINGDSASNRHVNQYDGQYQAAVTAFNSTSWAITESQDNTSAQGLGINYFYDYTNTVTWKVGRSIWVGNDGGTPTSASYHDYYYGYNQTSAITSIDLFNFSGNFTSGEVLLYGVS
jgi:hypothetical protein